MPIEFGLWRIDGEGYRRLSSRKLNDESRLEGLIIEDPNMLGKDLLIIGQQVYTGSGNRMDLLGIDLGGDLHIIELKRDRTPRDVVAQALDYAAWVRRLEYNDIVDIFDSFDDEREFEEAFEQKFHSARPEGEAGPPEDVNQAHSITIVASELDPATERIIEYLADEYRVPVNAIRFNYYEDGDREYVGRTWLIDPNEVPETPGKRETWNEIDFSVTFGHGPHRSWKDARKYGFVSGGQGEWYSRTLGQLFVGARVFVHIPQEGYVGVGEVTREKTPVTEFDVVVNGTKKNILSADLNADRMDENADDPDLREYLVGVKWMETRPIEEAYWETGMYANQNTATKLRNQFTLKRLYDEFDIDSDVES